jgi:hypothetical protein
MVRETRNARAAAAALGAPNAFNNRMKRDEGFRRRVQEAVAEASERLAGAEGAFPERGERTAVAERTLVYECPRPPTETRTSTCPLFPPPPPIVPLATDAAALGGYLRPGHKRVSAAPQPVIRRNCQGRTQVRFAQAGHWTQLAGLTVGGGYEGPGRSPDRADALVWAMTELMLTPRAEPRVRRL